MAIVFRHVAGMMSFKNSVNDYVEYMKIENSRLSQLIDIIQQGSPDDDECKKAVKDITELTEYLAEIIKFFEDVGKYYEDEIKIISTR